MDGETAEDGLDFTPPDTPSQHYSYHPTPMADGETMGNSPSKDDAEGAGGSSQGSQMSQGGVLASLGPLTSPSNPTLGGDGSAAGGGAVAKDVAAAGHTGAAAAADEDTDDGDDDEMTPSIDYNQDTEKFVPSARASGDAPAAAPAQDGDCMSPLTMTEDHRERGHGDDEDDNGHDDASDDEGEMEVNSEDEAAIAQDGIYQPADGIAVGTIIGGRDRGRGPGNQGDQADGSDGDDDDDDDEEFGSMEESALAQSGGLLTQGGGFGDDSDDDSSDSGSDGDDNDNSASAAAAQDASDDDSDTEERSQNLLAPDDNGNTDEGCGQEEQEGSATEPLASAPSDTEQTATADELEASTAEVEAEPMDVDTGMFVTGLTEQTESQTEPTLAGGAADTEETGEGEDADGTANDADENGGGYGDDSAEQQQQQQEEDIDDEEMVEGLTEETETQTQPAVSADANSQDGASSDVAAAAADSSEVVPASSPAAIPLVEAEIVGLTEQSEWSQHEYQKTADKKLQAGEDDDDSAKNVAVQKVDSVDAADGDDDEAHESVLGQTGADETTIRTSQSSTTKESSNAGESDTTKAAAASETHSPKQLLTDAELMPPPASPHRGSPTKGVVAGVQAEESSQRSLASKLAEGSEDTYDSFGDLPVFSGDTEQMVMPSMDRFTANEDSPAKPGCSLLQSTSTSRQEFGADGAVARSQGATKSQAEEKHSSSKGASEILASKGGATSPRRESQTEDSKNDNAEESEEGTGASSLPAADLGDLYDNAETEGFQESADNNDGSRNEEEVDTDASTPLVSHTQTYIEGQSNAGFSYPRNDELEPVEEKKVDSPSPAVAATPLQDSHVDGPNDSQDEVEGMDIGSSMRSVDEEVVNGAPSGAEAGAACAQTAAATPANSKKDRAGDPVTPAGARLESEAATVMLSTTPASSKKMGRDTVTPAKASEATTVILSTTPASTKKGAENIAEGDNATKNFDTTPPPSSKKPATPASSERTTADSASSTSKSGLSISSSPHSQPLLSPVNDVPPSSNFNSERSSLLKSVEASSKAVAKHDHLEGKGPSQDDIVDSDEDTCDELGAVESRSPPKDAGDPHTNVAPTDGDKEQSVNADGAEKGDKEEKKDNVAVKPKSAGGTNSSAIKRTPAPPAQWIHKHQKSNHKKNAAVDTARAEKDHSESEVEEEFDTEGGSEPTPRLFLPSNAKQRAAERKKELEVEADAFSSSDDDGMVARNARTAAIRRNNKGNHALQDTQDSPSESEDDEELDDRMKNNPFAQSARTSSARKRLKKRLRRDASTDKEQSPPPSVSSREGKKKAKRKSSSDYHVQDSLAMLSADASKHESSEDEEKEFQIDGIGDDASVSSSDNDYDVMPSQNTIDIDNLIGQAKGALQKFTAARNSDAQVAKLKRKVERLEKKCSKLKESYNKVRAENAVLKKSLEKKITQNHEMKVLLTKFNKMAQAGTLPAMGDNDAASASESDSSIDSQTASPPAKKRAKKSISSSKNPSARQRQADSTATAPVVVPPSSIKARGRLPAKTEATASSISGRKRRKEQKKSRSMRGKDESSDDENTTLAKLDTTPKAKRVGKKLNFDKHKISNTTSSGKAKATGGKGRKSTPAIASTASNVSNGRSRSRRGVSARDLIPKGMEHIRVSTIWNFLRDERGWTWRSGPEPYNNVYVRPGIEHLNVVGINQDFYEDGVYLYAEAKKAGFVVQEVVEDNMEEEEEIGDVDSDAAGDEGDEDGDSAAEEASIQSGQRGRRRGGYAQKQVNAATSPSGAHVSLSIGDHSDDEHDGDGDDDDEDEYEEEEEEEEEEQDSASEQEDVDGESNADERSVEEAVEEEVEESEVEEEEDDDDDIITNLDDTSLCGDARILTPRSVYLCAKLIRKFAKLSGDDSSFINLLWKPMWDMLKDGQGGKDKDDLKWGWARSKGQLAQRSYWYVAPQSKGSEGKQGVDYFETEEAVVLKVLQEIQQVDPSLLEASSEQVQAFEVVLRRATENNVAYSESRNNPDIGGGRRNRRKTHEASPFVYSAREKKTKTSPTKSKSKAKAKTTKKGANKSKKNAKAAASPEPKPTSPLKMSPSPRKAKNVAFSEPPPLSQNTMEGVETLLMMNASGAASNTDSTSGKATAVANNSRAVNPSIPDYEDIVTPKGIEALRAARLRSLQDVTPSPKKRSASPASAAKSSATSSGRKRQKTRSPQKEEAPSSIDTRLSQVPYQLCDSLDEMSQSQSDASSTFTRRKSTKHGDNGKVLPFNGLSFIGSGLDTKHADIIKALGGEYLSDVSTLDDTTIYGSLFFVSNVQQRRKLKYILASALGVPMLHYSWLKAIQNKYEAIEKSDEDDDSKADAIKQLPYNSDLFKAMRLPVGLSIKTGLYHLQKARHAKRWCRPGQENGKLIFKGLKLAVALENSKFETQWEAVLRAAGATIVKSSTLKSGKKCHLDALLVDRNSLPPHTTAVPSNISRCMNFVKNGNAKTSDGIAKIPIIDLSWALQCIVERERLAWDTDERYILYADASTSNENGDAMYEMKVKIDDIPIRFECGDIVEFGRTKSTERIGRIINIEGSKRTCATRSLEIQLLDRNGNFELVDGGEDATRVRINESELRRHITLLGAKDFKDIKKDGYLPSSEKETHIFLQKKPPSTSSSK